VATKTFSARADETRLALADSIARKSFGLSYAQYCGSVLLDMVCEQNALPTFALKCEHSKVRALDEIKDFSKAHHNERIAAMSDAELKEMIASRYA